MQDLSRGVIALLSAVGLLASGLGSPAHGAQGMDGVPGVSIQIGANFYPLETWEPGKERRWMSQDGEIVLLNGSASVQTVNLRFYAESFHVPRDLRIVVDGRLVAQWAIEPVAQRYIVVRSLPLRSDRTRVVFQTPQPALAPARVGRGADQRPLSVAFSPFSVISAGAPEAQTDWTAAFAAGPAESRYFTPQENAAHYLRRQGRLVEAARAYKRALADGGTNYTYLFYGMTLLALDRRAESKRMFLQCTGARGSGLRDAWVRDLCQKAAAYLDESVILSQQDRDPGRSARAEGRIHEAVETYRAVVAREPDALHANYWLGLLYALAERGAMARVHLDRVIAATGDSADGRFLKASRPYF